MGKRNSKVVIGASQRVTGDIATVGKFRIDKSSMAIINRKQTRSASLRHIRLSSSLAEDIRKLKSSYLFHSKGD